MTVTDIIANLTKNAETPARWWPRRSPHARGRECKCGSALAHALITDRKAVPEATRHLAHDTLIRQHFNML